MNATCVQCSAPLKPGARFCGGCGARQPAPAPEATEDADALARYRTVLESFADNGALEARELSQLETLRQRLGLSLATHERLLDEFEQTTPAPVTLNMFIDVTTIRHFEVASRCMLRVKLENHGDLALERLDIHYQVHGSRPLEPVSTATLFPGHHEVLPLWLVPEVAGFHELHGVLYAVDLMGEAGLYAFDSVQFRVGAGDKGPAISVVHVDQRSARVVDNSGGQFAAPTPSAGGLVAEGQWHPVPLRALSPDRAARFSPTLARVLGGRVVNESGGQPGNEPGGPGVTAAGEARVSERTSSSTTGTGTGTGAVDFEIETEVARYHVTSTLAQGDLATVYGGRRAADNALVALKIVDDPQDNDLMQAEIRAVGMLRATDEGQNEGQNESQNESRNKDEGPPQLKHLPVIVDRLRTSDGRLGTVLEHIDGYDLYSLREKLPGGVPARHIMWIMRRCLSALGWAHSHGVLHGNLDPAHIMIRPHDHNVWLIDWCYAIINPARTGQSFRCLNEEYSPPEVAGRKPPLPSSDLYSLGKCMIYAIGGDPETKTLPEGIDERLARFLRFFVLESPLGRAQDAWDMYTQLDRLRHDIYGRHRFVPFKV